MTPLPPDFREFLQSLNARGVEYLLIGGYAVSFHGYPRATADIDVWVAMSPENAAKVVAALRDFGFDVPSLEEELFLIPDSIIRMGVKPFLIEVTTTISGVEFDECYEARVQAEIEGLSVPIINAAHLKINKAASGRLKDLADLENLP